MLAEHRQGGSPSTTFFDFHGEVSHEIFEPQLNGVLTNIALAPYFVDVPARFVPF